MCRCLALRRYRVLLAGAGLQESSLQGCVDLLGCVERSDQRGQLEVDVDDPFLESVHADVEPVDAGIGLNIVFSGLFLLIIVPMYLQEIPDPSAQTGEVAR